MDVGLLPNYAALIMGGVAVGIGVAGLLRREPVARRPSIRAIDMGPGDRLVLEYAERLTKEQRVFLRDQLEPLLRPGDKRIVLLEGFDGLAVLKASVRNSQDGSDDSNEGDNGHQPIVPLPAQMG